MRGAFLISARSVPFGLPKMGGFRSIRPKSVFGRDPGNPQGLLGFRVITAPEALSRSVHPPTVSAVPALSVATLSSTTWASVMKACLIVAMVANRFGYRLRAP